MKLEYTPQIELHRDNYTITDDRSKFQIEVIHDFLANHSYWAQCIPIEIVHSCINGSLCFGILDGSNQVGFARVVTDGSTYGYIADVFVLPGHRGKGLSKWLMAAIMYDPRLQGFRRWSLATRDAQGLYAQFGFAVASNPERKMEILQRDIYKSGKENNLELP